LTVPLHPLQKGKGSLLLIYCSTYDIHDLSKNDKLTTISVSRKNYIILKNLGKTGDSFNDVVTKLLGYVDRDSQPDGKGESSLTSLKEW
jgi:hypothetical protein